MKIDLQGRVRNIKLNQNKALRPLFEAISNSIHAIEEESLSTAKSKKIQIKLIRENSFLAESKIIGFKIVDNGIGFTSRNFEAFETVDTTNKISLGGKGIGRLLWLKVFDLVEITSTFQENNNWFYREFKFTLPDGIDSVTYKQLETIPKTKSTCVTLKNIKKQYANSCPKNIDLIAKKILFHFLHYFITGDIPYINIKDGDNNIELNKLYSSILKSNIFQETITIRDKQFTIYHIHLPEKGEFSNRAYCCAHRRIVSDINLENSINDIKNGLQDKNGETFFYSSYIIGELFDEYVNQERTNFLLNEKEPDIFCGISLDKIKKEIINAAKKHLSDFLKKKYEEKKQKIERYIMTEAPKYRVLLKKIDHYVDKISGEINSRELDICLHTILFEEELKLKKEGKKLLKQSKKEIQDIKEYRKRCRELAEQISDFGKSQLTEYIAHRKIILELFEKSLEGLNEKYELEETIHSLIFPLRSTSDDIDFEKHNLWIIDEKLAYHRYLTSDIRLKNNPLIHTNALERPDILIFNEPIAVVDGEPPFSSIVIFEFKRPMRDNYTENEEPIIQILNYIDKLREGEILDNKGRPIDTHDNLHFYAYIISDIRQNLEKFLVRHGFQKTPEQPGYFLYHSNYNAYIEVIPFNKLLLNAKKRNRILFEKLGIIG
jgi:hypothetical protein